MLKSSIIIKSLLASIVIKSKNKKDIERVKGSIFLKRYIPSCRIISEIEKTDCVLNLKHRMDYIKINYPRAIYSSNNINIKDIITLAEYLLERARQERGIYCLHGSACIIKDRAIIFWGSASGMGKTSLCKELQDKYNAKWLADEKILINLKNQSIEGYVNVAYMKNGHKKYFNKLGQDLNKVIPILFLVYPFLFGEQFNELELIKWDKRKLQWHLYEELNRKIRANSRTFFNNTEPILSLDTIELARKRIKLINFFG